jgi:hypothetical protein
MSRCWRLRMRYARWHSAIVDFRSTRAGHKILTAGYGSPTKAGILLEPAPTHCAICGSVQIVACRVRLLLLLPDSGG